MNTKKTRLVLLLLFPLLFSLLSLTILSYPASADYASDIFFRELSPLEAGKQEILLQVSETPRHLRVNLFSDQESIADAAVWEHDSLRLRLKRAVTANETLLFLADGEDASGMPFSLRQEWHVSLYDSLTRQVEAILREVERDWLPGADGSGGSGDSGGSGGSGGSADSDSPGGSGITRLPYRLGQFPWVSTLRSFDPGPEFTADGSLTLRDCSRSWLVHYLTEDGNIVGTWTLDGGHNTYRPPNVPAADSSGDASGDSSGDSSGNPNSDPPALNLDLNHDLKLDLVISHEMKSPDNQVTEFVYNPETLRLKQIRFVGAGFRKASFSLFCLPGASVTWIDSPANASDSRASPAVSSDTRIDSPAASSASQAYAVILMDYYEAERVRVFGRYDSNGFLYEVETNRGLSPVLSPNTQIEGVVIIP